MIEPIELLQIIMVLVNLIKWRKETKKISNWKFEYIKIKNKIPFWKFARVSAKNQDDNFLSPATNKQTIKKIHKWNKFKIKSKSKLNQN